MSSVPLKDADDQTFRPDTFIRQEGPNTVHMQAVVPVDPATGDPLDTATETTLAALATAVDTLNTAATAIKNAVEALNAKTTAMNTGAVALDASTLAALETINAAINGTVALDGATLAALETINSNVSGTVALDGATLAALETINANINFPATQPVSAAALPLPAGAATEATLATMSTALGQPLTTNLADEGQLLRYALKALAKLTFTLNGLRTEVTLAASQTLATVTTVSTVSAVSAANAVAMGRNTTDGQGIQLSQLNYNNGFRSRLN